LLGGIMPGSLSFLPVIPAGGIAQKRDSAEPGSAASCAPRRIPDSLVCASASGMTGGSLACWYHRLKMFGSTELSNMQPANPAEER